MAFRYRVGVFDSGIGGLTVLKECARLVPGCRYYYLGDNRRAPYGSRSAEEILSFVREALDTFLRLKTDVVILACNTATAVCADSVRREYPFPVIGTEPAVAPAARVCRNALVLATPATCASPRFRALVSANGSCRFTVFPAEGLAAAIEKSVTEGGTFSLDEYLPEGKFEGVVLGCTHYIFQKREISEFYGAPAFDGNEGIARRLSALLSEKAGGARGKEKKKLGLVTPNKSSRIASKKREKVKIIFIGRTKKRNKMTYKRMFG